MTPKKLLDKIANEATDEIGKARYEGALAMYESFLDKQRKYYDTHKEHNREYQREYQKRRYRMLHGLPEEDEPRDLATEEAIMKEVESIK